MNKRTITITVDEDVEAILDELKGRDINRSGHLNNLLRYSKSCNFIIYDGKKTKDVFMENEIPSDEEIEEIRKEQGIQ